MFLSASPPENEDARLARLAALNVLGSPPEPMFDALARAAADLCATPIGLIALMDEHRNWFKAAVGLEQGDELPREVVFCTHAILGHDVLEIGDATQDPRFADNPLVTGPADVRFYAGAPIRLSDGVVIGTLCVLDHTPRKLTRAQHRTLEHLADAAAAAFESRELALLAIAQTSCAEAEVAELYRSTPAMLHSIDADGIVVSVSDTWLSELGYRRDEVIGRPVVEFLTPESRRHALETVLPRYFETGSCTAIEYHMVRKDGEVVEVLLSSRLSRQTDGRPQRSMSVSENITQRRRAERALIVEQDRMTRILEGTDAGTWELNVQTGEARYNERWARMAGYTLAELGEISVKTWHALLDERDLERANALYLDHCIGRADAYSLECRIRHKDGRRIWIHDRGRVSQRDADGAALWMHGTRADITQRKQMESDLARSRQLLQVTLDSIGDAVITTDTDSLVQWLNPVAERMTGWTKAEAVGKALAQVFVIIDEETRSPVIDPVAVCLQKAQSVGIASRITLISRNGVEYGIEDSASPIREPDGQVHGAVLVFHDVSEQRRLNHEMSHRASHDLLTGLINRGEFERRLQRLLEIVGTSDGANALLYIDLDQFKLVNDACGHAAGDQLLRQVSSILRGCVRGNDALARLGGDEFGMILEHCDMQNAQRVAQKICDEMDEFRFVHDGRRFRVGTSIGLVPVDSRWTHTKTLLQAADAACYAAKDGGRNRVHAWFDSDQAVKTRHGDMQWVSRLELALDEDRFELFGQRIEAIDPSSDPGMQGLHFEVLLRLSEANGSFVPPGAFLPAAERFHLITRIDRWVVHKAFEWLRATEQEGVDVQMMSVNLSGQSLGDRAFHRDVLQMIRRAPFDLRKLCFEVTETAAITHLSEARSFIDEVRLLGVRIALDDFGAGASSFGYLKSLPVDFLKIDGHFITNLLEDELNHAAVRCFCDVAKVVGVKTIAEFVERRDVRDALADLGVDMAQGYLVHRPEPLATLLACATA